MGPGDINPVQDVGVQQGVAAPGVAGANENMTVAAAGFQDAMDNANQPAAAPQGQGLGDKIAPADQAQQAAAGNDPAVKIGQEAKQVADALYQQIFKKIQKSLGKNSLGEAIDRENERKSKQVV